MNEKCSIINEFIKCQSKVQFKGAFILIIVGLIMGFVILMIRKLHRPTLINTIIAGVTANLLSFGVTLFCGFFELKYVIIDGIVTFILGVISILLSMKITSLKIRWNWILFITVCGLMIVGFLSIILSFFYCIFQIVYNTCWIFLILLAIIFTPYYFSINNESTEYSSYLIGFINLFEMITLYLFILITTLDIEQITLKCSYDGN
ncbi:unnamed protein product [Schistosoma rodhaini]|uniref:Transporter n=1 Tax=Schistosoma mansoni TaxID=6183 RepID=G4VL03_SCHMA|nr:hypothetical protein Smp_131410 [Schistosoma mansoni]CAH8631797.1 unnamed protein product [Schistosoma rodhaini]|eukprot:XP_018653397.1 hypothetical protein Smp_131410 [Schistosoma mansoni]